MINYVENYLKWLKDNMSQCEIEKDVIEITAPFLDRHNDYTQIYVKKEANHKYFISDDGYVLSDLEMSGMEFNTKKRKKLLQQTLKRMGVNLDEKSGELYIECMQKDLPTAQHRLIQSMLDVNDMFYLSAPNIKNIFFEDVKTFFDKKEIYYVEDVIFSGKSGFSYSYPFMLQRNKRHPERIIKLMNAPNRSNVERYIFAWNDIKEVRDDPDKPSRLFILVNDYKKVSNSLLEGFQEYNIDTILWSERMNAIEKFA